MKRKVQQQLVYLSAKLNDPDPERTNCLLFSRETNLNWHTRKIITHISRNSQKRCCHPENLPSPPFLASFTILFICLINGSLSSFASEIFFLRFRAWLILCKKKRRKRKRATSVVVSSRWETVDSRRQLGKQKLRWHHMWDLERTKTILKLAWGRSQNKC